MANCVSMMTEMLHLYKFTIWAIPAETTIMILLSKNEIGPWHNYFVSTNYIFFT